MSDLWAAHEDQKKKSSGRDNSPRANLPRVIRLTSGRCLTMTVKTVYAMMQPLPLKLPPESASMGVEVVGSESLEGNERNKANKSII